MGDVKPAAHSIEALIIEAHSCTREWNVRHLREWESLRMSLERGEPKTPKTEDQQGPTLLSSSH
jgi:hypothetical protein